MLSTTESKLREVFQLKFMSLAFKFVIFLKDQLEHTRVPTSTLLFRVL